MADEQQPDRPTDVPCPNCYGPIPCYAATSMLEDPESKLICPHCDGVFTGLSDYVKDYCSSPSNQ